MPRALDPTLTRLLQLCRLDRRWTRGKGVWLFDERGRWFLDGYAQYGAVPLGHNAPTCVAALRDALAAHQPAMVQPYRGVHAEALAEELIQRAPGQLAHVVFTTSGAASVEAAVKLVRAETGRPLIVTARGGYHGKTLGTLALHPESRHASGFGPLAPGARCVDWGDPEALAACLSAHPGQVAGVLLEPVLGEGGVHPAPAGYLRAARELCDRHGAALILDEVQTGLGRTGALFACEREAIAPDVLCLAKALSGGLIPLGACLANERFWSARFGLGHGSTFANNELACAVGRAVLAALDDELLSEVERKGAWLLEQLEGLARRYPRWIRAARGQGLLTALELTRPAAKLSDLLSLLAHHGLYAYALAGAIARCASLLVLPTLGPTPVLRIAPPLTIAQAELELLVAGLRGVFDALERQGVALFLGALGDPGADAARAPGAAGADAARAPGAAGADAARAPGAAAADAASGVARASGTTSAGAARASGTTGAARASGTVRASGTTGAARASGTTGAACASGATGAACASGATGAACASGATGAAHASGATGAAHASGTTGAARASGTTGAARASGTTGGPGTTGAHGTTGSSDMTGAHGTTGSSGTTGAGAATDAADAGAASGTARPPGAADARAASGTPRASGATGPARASGTTGAARASGTTGAARASGTTGAARASGTTGAARASGTTGAVRGPGTTGAARGPGTTGAARGPGTTGAVRGSGATGAARGPGTTGADAASGAGGGRAALGLPAEPARLPAPARPKRLDYAFVAHLTRREDVAITNPGLELSAAQLDQACELLAQLPPSLVCRGPRLRDATGRALEGAVILLPLLPAGLRRLGARRACRRIEEAVELGVSLGARVIGLGGHTTPFSRHGEAVRGRGARITTGNAFTAHCALAGVEARLAARDQALAELEAPLAVLGAGGSVGSLCARLAARAGARRLLLLGNPRSGTARLERLAEDLRERYGGEVVVDRDPRRLVGAGVVIAATASRGGALGRAPLSSGALVCDLARPPDATPALRARRDLELFTGGLVALPDPAARFGAGNLVGLPSGVQLACLAETILLACEEEGADHVGRDLPLELVDRVAALASRHGFQPHLGGEPARRPGPLPQLLAS